MLTFSKFFHEKNNRKIKSLFIDSECPHWRNISENKMILDEIIHFWEDLSYLKNDEIIKWMELDGKWAKKLIEI